MPTKKPPKLTGPLPGGPSEAKSSYKEAQEDELLALSSIYGDDYQLLETKAGAWKKSEPAFQIKIKSLVDEKVQVVLRVTFGATYPRSPPLLTLVNNATLRDTTIYKLRTTIETLPKQLANQQEPQAMIMDIVTALQEALDMEAEARAAGEELPSLEEERARQEAASTRQLKEQEEVDNRRRRLEAEESERIEREMIEKQIKKQHEAKRPNRPPALSRELTLEEDPAESRDRLVFDRPISIADEDGDVRMFQAITDKMLIRHSVVSDCFTAKPIMKGPRCQLLALKETKLNRLDGDGDFKSSLRALEAELEKLKKVSHSHIIELFDYKVERSADNIGNSDLLWTASILMEYGNKGSLEELLQIADDGLGTDKARSWTIELLHALKYLHESGIVHQDIHAGNVLLVRGASGEVTAKLTDAGYQRKLHGLKNVRSTHTMTLAKSAYWIAPENANLNHPRYTQKTDIWDFGGVFLQIVFGLAVFQKYTSPHRLMDALALTDSLLELLHNFFKMDPKKRLRAFDLISSEWFATDAPIMLDDRPKTLAHMPQTPGRHRRESFASEGPYNSRWKMDFSDVTRLGKGGFGEVLKARKKLDGQYYAIKTIVQNSSASLTEVLKEVRLLSTLNHPYVVRYYNTWTEEVLDESPLSDDDSESTNEPSSMLPQGSRMEEDDGPQIEFDESTGGLDFISSSHPQIEFGYGSEDSEDEEDEYGDEDEDEDDNTDTNDNDTDDAEDSTRSAIPLSSNQRNAGYAIRPRSGSRSQKFTRTVLYIQMEYCERRTLRDLIRRDLYKDPEQVWRLFRQTLEGMAHIHELNVVHRDLKPENLFISAAGAIKIGDFGLATSAQYASFERSFTGIQSSHNLTTSVGTASYTAPEVRSGMGTYNSKVDMYSLGIIFFEMNYAPMGGMERATVLQALRQPDPQLPADFDMKSNNIQADIILSLVDHKPKNRPTSSSLLKSGQIPVQMESETVQQALAAMVDPKSAYYQKVMNSLFSRQITPAEDFAWDVGGAPPLATDMVVRSIVKDQLVAIFRRHGALEIQRQLVFPRSAHYGSTAVQLLEHAGTPVQLCYDLTLPHARAVARHPPSFSRSFTFGNVFRDRTGNQPLSSGEVDFDIVSDGLDLALKDAEVIKVVDEIITEFPNFATRQMCFNLNHSDLLNLIFDFCKIDDHSRTAVAESLGKLNIQQWNWQKIRAELRSPLIGVSSTSLDDLQRFDFRDTPAKAFEKLKTIFEGTDSFEKASSTIAHVNEVIKYSKLFDVHTKIYVTPLSCLREKFCKGGLTFSCVFESKQRDVFAAGGRYDALIREYRPRTGSQSGDRNAVGFSLAWERLSAYMAKYLNSNGNGKKFLKKADEENKGRWTARRCDVLVASLDVETLRTTGVELLQTLWANDISAELAPDARSPEELVAKHRDEQHCWIIMIKQDSVLKVKSMNRKDVQDIDIPVTQLIPWLRGELREREQREGTSERARLLRQPSHHDASDMSNHEQAVHVLVGQARSKKSNRQNIVDQAQSRAAGLVKSFLDGPIAAIETTDKVMELIRDTRLSDPDSWRDASHSVAMAERRYVGEIHDLMIELRDASKEKEGKEGEGSRNAFVYNFRTGSCLYYDLSA